MDFAALHSHSDTQIPLFHSSDSNMHEQTKQSSNGFFSHVFPPSFSVLLLYEYTLFLPVLISLHLSHFRDFPQFMAVSSYNRTEEAQFSSSSLSFHLKMPYNDTMLLMRIPSPVSISIREIVPVIPAQILFVALPSPAHNSGTFI